MVHGTILAVERKKEGGLGRVGSGRVGSGRVGSGRVGSGRVVSDRVVSDRVGSGQVGSGRVGSGRVNVVLYPTGPWPHFFSHRRDYRAVYWALRFASFEQAMLSLDKLSKNALMQNTTDFYRYFLRVSNGNSY